MKTITLAGPYPAEVKPLIQSLLPDDYSIQEIKSQDDLNKQQNLEHVILRTFKIDKTLIDKNPSLKVIQRWGAGYDTIDVEAASDRNIPVLIAAGVNACAVSEHVLLLILASLKNLIPIHQNTYGGIWDRSTYTHRSYMLQGKTVGLIGLGRIGMLTAQKLNALGARVAYYDICRMNPEYEKTSHIEYAGFDELLTTSDIISVHVPLNSNTHNLIDYSNLRLMKSNAIVINTSRGGIVNEGDLARALRENLISGAALDCFSEEPLVYPSIFEGLDNIIMTPHIGGSVSDLNPLMAKKVVENILDVIGKKPVSPLDFVNSKSCTYPA